VTPRETLYTQREAARTKKSQKFRRNVNEENVHQMELLKVPEIIDRGGELVARGVWWKRGGGRAGARQGRTAQNSGRMFVFAATLVPSAKATRHPA
jgi:hypothetical protein